MESGLITPQSRALYHGASRAREGPSAAAVTLPTPSDGILSDGRPPPPRGLLGSTQLPGRAEQPGRRY